MEIPTIVLPEPLVIPEQTIPLPKADLPSYKPIVVPPNNLESPEGVEMETEEKEDPGMQKINIPIVNVKVPVPEQEILITAGTTAAVSVAATLTATTAFKWAVKVLKPIIKTAIGKIWTTKKKENG
ncbi:MAG: hypothetical protein CL815_01190 [Coraliomargarita sp.]|nr:hypothetical protein [Coraliomargarita sp.]